MGGVLAAWQFVTARERADEARSSAEAAHSASVARSAAAQVTSSPLQAALALLGIDPAHAPTDALAIGYQMLAVDIPAARLRGHRAPIIAGAVDATGRVSTIDRRGGVYAGRAEDYRQLITPTEKVVDAVIDQAGQRSMRVFEHGEVRRGDDTVGCVMGGSFQPHHVVPSPSFEQALVIGFNQAAWWCDFATTRNHRIALEGDFVAAWLDTGDARSWIVVTSDGELSRVNIADGATSRLTSPTDSPAIRDAGLVGIAIGGAGQRFAVVAGERIFVGQVTGAAFEVYPVTVTKPVALAFSPKGDRLAVATADGVVAIVGPRGDVVRQLDHRILFFRLAIDTNDTNEISTLMIRVLAWAPDGRRLATVQAGFGIRVWDTDPVSSAEPRVLRGHGAADLLAWSPDGGWLASFGDGEVQLWHGTNPQRVQLLDRLSTAALIGANTLLVGSVHGTIRVYSDGRLDRDPLLLKSPAPCGDGKTSPRVVLLHDEPGAGFWSARADGRVTLWDRRHGSGVSPCTSSSTFAYDARLHGVVFVDADHHLAVVDSSGPRVLDPTALTSEVSALSTSGDGRWIAAGTSTGHIVRWDLGSTPIARIEHHPHGAAVNCIDLEDATGDAISGGEDGIAVLDDFVLDRPVSQWLGDGSWIESCAVTSTRAMIGSSNGRAWLLPRAYPGVTLPLRTRLDVAHAGPADPVVLHEREELAITAGAYDGYVRVWSLTTRQMLGEGWLETPIVAIVDAGAGIFAASEGGMIRYLPLSFEAVQQALRARTSAELTAAERVQVFGELLDVAEARYEWTEIAHGRHPIPANAEYDAGF